MDILRRNTFWKKMVVALMIRITNRTTVPIRSTQGKLCNEAQ